MREFKLIKELGLVAEYQPSNNRMRVGEEWVKASDLEALLEKGVRVYGAKGQSVREDLRDGNWFLSRENWPEADTTALMINIRPIVKDTAESLLEECMRIIDDGRSKVTVDPRSQELYERARKLLASRQESGGEK